jgi:hypothetical protein
MVSEGSAADDGGQGSLLSCSKRGNGGSTTIVSDQGNDGGRKPDRFKASKLPSRRDIL